jgi:hypothetical protein
MADPKNDVTNGNDSDANDCDARDMSNICSMLRHFQLNDKLSKYNTRNLMPY